LRDKKGSTWFATPNYLVKIGSDGHSWSIIKEHTSRDDFGWLASIFAMYMDKDNNLWLGCQQGLAFSVGRPSCFASLSKSSRSLTAIQHAYYLNPVSDSLLYCCAQEGLYEVHTATGEIRALD